AGEFPFKFGNNQGYRFSCSGGGGDNVLISATTTAPVLQGRSVYGLLCCRHRVYGAHQSLYDPEFVVEDLGYRRDTVGCARCVGDDGLIGFELLVVDPHDESWGVVFGRGGEDYLFRASLAVYLREFSGEEESR